jgi:hypothetical protein
MSIYHFLMVQDCPISSILSLTCIMLLIYLWQQIFKLYLTRQEWQRLYCLSSFLEGSQLQSYLDIY